MLDDNIIADLVNRKIYFNGRVENSVLSFQIYHYIANLISETTRHLKCWCSSHALLKQYICIYIRLKNAMQRHVTVEYLIMIHGAGVTHLLMKAVINIQGAVTNLSSSYLDL